jgi:alpha-glucosidase (family GH31 glycosyl hydrolase)
MTPFVNTTSGNENVAGQNLGKASNYDEAANRGFFVRASSGGPPLVVPWWKGKGSPVDFTNPDARKWLTDQLQSLVANTSVTTLAGAKEPANWRLQDGRWRERQ